MRLGERRLLNLEHVLFAFALSSLEEAKPVLRGCARALRSRGRELGLQELLAERANLSQGGVLAVALVALVPRLRRLDVLLEVCEFKLSLVRALRGFLDGGVRVGE